MTDLNGIASSNRLNSSFLGLGFYLVVLLVLYPVGWGWIDLKFECYLLVHTVLFGTLFLFRNSNVSRKQILVVAILGRILLVGVPPFTTADVGRYFWDGFVLSQGLDPYTLTPNQLKHLASQWPLPFDNRDYVSLYPPLGMMLFRVSVVFGYSYALWVWKSILLVVSCFTVFFLGRVIKSNRSFFWIVLNPLLLLETMVGSHIDAVVGLAIVSAMYLALEKRWALVGVSLGLGTLVKLSPLLCILASLTSLGFRRSGLKLAGGFFLTVGVGYGAFLLLGFVPLGSIGTFFKLWRFGSPLQFLFDELALVHSVFWVRALIAGGVIFWVSRSHTDFLARWALWLALLFLLSPVVFPWYLIPLVVIPRYQLFVSGWAFSLPFTYEVMTQYVDSGLWQPSAWPLCLIFLGWVLAGFFQDAGRKSC